MPTALLYYSPPRDVSQHPIFWVQCFACGAFVRMVRAGGPALPSGWSVIRPMRDGKMLAEVYASPSCTFRAGVLAGARFDTANVSIATVTYSRVQKATLGD